MIIRKYFFILRGAINFRNSRTGPRGRSIVVAAEEWCNCRQCAGLAVPCECAIEFYAMGNSESVCGGREQLTECCPGAAADQGT